MKRFSKRLLALLMGTVMVTSLTGCGEKATETADAEQTVAEQTETTETEIGRAHV